LALTDVVLPQAGVTAVRMVMALGTALIGLRLARALADQGAAGPRLEHAIREHLDRIRQGQRWNADARARNQALARSWAKAAAHWSGPALARAIRATYQADRALKATTVSDDRATLRTLVLSLAAMEKAA
jgi:DNA polymerase III delta subunit